MVNWVRDVLENPRPDTTLDFVKDFQLNLYQEEIYVFTPNGELKTLPNKSTPIDFAFEIHSEIGERAMAAKVNGKMVPLRQKLKNGDQVEIITGNKVNLNPDWIDDVVTHKAKSRIRQYIKQKQRIVSDKGKEIWYKRLDRGNIEISDQELTKIAKKFKFESTQSMFLELGMGSLDVNSVYKEVKKYKSTGRLEEDPSDIKAKSEQEIQERYLNTARNFAAGNALILDDYISNVKYSYANCCNPIPGDNVLGFISRNGEVKVHRTMCNNAQHLLKTEGNRIVDVQWAKHIDNKFLGAIKVVGEDRVGMINDITDVLSKSLSTNMKSINVTSEEGMFEGIITLYVDGLTHLDTIMKRLNRVEGVKTVLRYE
jgi:GTP pyrophosphokinase/guanosine-3',5'-bis(diphosphate) 3'-pyrophosphohydrolase